jgi:4-hydroxythreonine-4-phosphate dehydrogenase
VKLALTPGCPAGIGPEVIARAALDAALPRGCRLVFMASPAQLLLGAKRARVPAAREDGDVVVLGRGRHRRAVTCAVFEHDDRGARARPGVVDDDAIASQRDALVRACEAAARGDVDAIVTGPVRKKALVIGGVAYPGQTEVVAHYLGDGAPPLMVFAGAAFVLGLCTVHEALRDVPDLVTAERLDRCIARLADAARAIGKRRDPRVVVLAVNPHAGEGGMFGDEDDDVVHPAVVRARSRGLHIAGPLAADGFFADVARGTAKADAVLAMHHDQGLAPYKLLVRGEGINVTWGTRVPRTSPDHGTADALAGKGVASSSSMRAAIELAARIARARSRPDR